MLRDWKVSGGSAQAEQRTGNMGISSSMGGPSSSCVWSSDVTVGEAGGARGADTSCTSMLVDQAVSRVGEPASVPVGDVPVVLRRRCVGQESDSWHTCRRTLEWRGETLIASSMLVSLELLVVSEATLRLRLRPAPVAEPGLTCHTPWCGDETGECASTSMTCRAPCSPQAD